jgi:hypothetical protein
VNVLVIPEDFRKDEFILQPILEAMFAAIGRPRAQLRVCRDPLLGGVDQAMRFERIAEIVGRYQGMVDCFILIVDRDGDVHRKAALDHLEARIVQQFPGGAPFIAENAWQEIEAWILAGHDLLPGARWQEVRAERQVKERYFEPFAAAQGVVDGPGGGRKSLARDAAARYGRIRQLCPEDVGAMEQRLLDLLRSGRLTP